MPAPKDYMNNKFGRLTVVGKKLVPKGTRHRVYWVCECECGGKVKVRTDSLTRGLVRSCGCMKKEQDAINLTANHTHKLSGTRLYHTWTQMKMRCHNPNDNSYERYGGRGIKVCDEWRNSFETFKTWALSNGYSDNLTIDRIDVNGNYSPDNCRWATIKEQSLNRRSNIKVPFNGTEVTLKELSELVDIHYSVLVGRYKRGDRGERLIRPSGADRNNAKGSKRALSKLREEQVIEIKLALENGAKQKSLAVQYGVSQGVINSIAKKRTWKHV